MSDESHATWPRAPGGDARRAAAPRPPAAPPNHRGPSRPTERSGSPRGVAVQFALGIAAIAIALSVASLALVAGLLAPAPVDSAGPSTGGGTSLPTTSAGPCNPSTPTPSSLLVPIPNPTTALTAGGSVSATYELAVVNYTSANYGTSVYLPSVFATFPLTPSGSAQLYFAPRTVTVTTSGWTNSTTVTKTYGTGSSATFSSSSATLSTQKLAVMAVGNYGTVTLEFHWHWSETTGGGTTTTGAWSTPTRSSNWPTSVASIFYPAPYVSIVSTTGPQVTIGANITTVLGGSVASRYFFQELENSSTGKVFQSAGQTAPSGAKQFTASIVMLNYNHYLDPGKYLLHFHDGCGAMLYSLPETASYASSASVAVTVNPSSCGSVTIDGTAHASGTSFSIVPRSASYAFTIPACSGHAFKSWNGGGGVHIVSSGWLRVSSDGSFTVTYT